MTTWLDNESARISMHEYLDAITLGVLRNNYCYGKYQLRITRALRKVLNSHTFQIFTSKLWLSITIHDATKSRIICLTKTEGFLPIKFSVSYEKGHNQRLQGQTSNKTVTNQNHTEPNEPKLLFETGLCQRSCEPGGGHSTFGVGMNWFFPQSKV